MSLTKVSYSMIRGAVANVLDFGAIGNGTTDDTAAIQAAINSLSVTGGVVYLPTNTYKITAPLTNTKSGVSLVGDGSAATIISNIQIGDAIVLVMLLMN